MFLQKVNARLLNVAKSPFTFKVSVLSERYLHWIAQYSLSKVSAIKSIPSSVFGSLSFLLIAVGISFNK